MTRLPALALSLLLVQGADLNKVIEKADALLEEAKAGYEEARAKSAASVFVDAGFKLEEARIKYLAIVEVGSPEQQKTATDRLRAVNQLAKLIHDGKVAVSGTPAESKPAPADKPADAPPPPDKPAEPEVKPGMVDVTRRLAVPDAAKQKEAEKIIRDLYKDQYAKKAPADRKLLGRQLLEQATKSSGDPAAAWVFFRESQDASAQGFDLRGAIDSVDASAKLFDVDPLPLKAGILATMGKAARTPEENGALAEASLQLVEEYVTVDQYEAADKAAVAALQAARRSNDIALATRVTTRAREIAEAKTRFVALKGVLQTLASKPDDPAANLEMGLYLCYVKGSWDLGPRFLAKGSDPALKALAEKELALPVQAADKATLADGWYDLAQKEASPLRKGQLLAHAGALYESALPDATGLLRIRIEKRMETAKAPTGPQGPSIDLLKMIDAKRDSVSGDWSIERGVLAIPAGRPTAWLQIPYSPPEEYDLKVVATRKSGSLDLYIFILVPGPKRLQVHIDGGPGGLEGGLRAGDDWNKSQATRYRDIKVFSDDKPHTLVMSVRRTSFALTIDGKALVNWKGDYTAAAASGEGGTNPAAFGIGNWESNYEISQILLFPVTGKGKPVPHVR